MKLTTRFLATLDAQDVFDVIAWQLLRQNARATAFDGVKCMYRAPDGKRCAIGWIMPDEVYHKTIEFMGVRDIAQQMINTNYADAFARFLYRHMDLLRDLQEMHDARMPCDWPVAMRVIAQRYHLNSSVIENCERNFGLVVKAAPPPRVTYRPVAPARLLDIAAMSKAKAPEESRETCSA
ncbi:hypothetical protein [Paraburkholderia silvatlantica]|uniref:hypothetical protein n=1 Tax=Paraburkholderia silvatlantica TaxID=321895 RepID=UPI0037529E21